MPTESTFFFAGLLFLAAALGYIFARFGDDEDDTGGGKARQDILRGFRYLLNEEPDRAVDVFTGIETVGEEGLDTQVALGALFRKRGEHDRAIRLHQHLMSAPELSAPQRERVMFALAEDFLSAGIFDRAEEFLLRLRQSETFRAPALRRLLHICEVTRDWGRAVQVCGELPIGGADAVPAAQLAQYYCELAEQARARGDLQTAGEWLQKASATDPGLSRILLVDADLARNQGRHERAVDNYRRISAQDPDLLGEVLPGLIDSARQLSGADGPDRLLRELVASRVTVRRPIALAALRNAAIDVPAIGELIRALIDDHAVLRDLVGSATLTGGLTGADGEVVSRARTALSRLVRQMPGYQCANCGYQSDSMQWRCPGCRSWDTVRPGHRVLPGDR